MRVGDFFLYKYAKINTSKKNGGQHDATIKQ